jgi:hypothetical protein
LESRHLESRPKEDWVLKCHKVGESVLSRPVGLPRSLALGALAMKKSCES